MAEHKEIADSAAPASSGGSDSADVRGHAQIVQWLLVALKNMRIYPPDHAQVQSSLARAFDAIIKRLASSGRMTLSVAADDLMIDDRPIGQANAACTAVAQALHAHDIAVLTFMPGLEIESLAEFIALVSQTPDDLLKNQQQHLLAVPGHFRAIEVLLVDYSRFTLADEERPEDQTADSDVAGENLWLDMVRQLTGGSNAKPLGDPLALVSPDLSDPVQLAEFINDHPQVGGSGMAGLTDMIGRLMAQAGGGGDSHAEATRVRVNRLLDRLNPDIRRQFLAATCRRLNENKPEAKVVVGGFSDQLVIEMLMLAGEGGGVISPSLIALIGQLADRRQSDVLKNAVTMTAEQIRALMAPERFGDYVTDEYDLTLQRLAADQDANRLARKAGFSISDHLPTLEENYLSERICRAIMAFMEMDSSEDEYADYGEKALGLATAVPASLSFPLLADMVTAFSDHAMQQANRGIRLRAKGFLEAMCRATLITAGLDALGERSIDAHNDPLPYLRQLMPDAVPTVLAYMVDKRADALIYHDLLVAHPDETITAVIAALDQAELHDRSYLVSIFADVAVKASHDCLKSLLNHQEQAVVAVVLDILFQNGQPEAVDWIRQMLNSPQWSRQRLAIEMAGKHRVREVTKALVAMLRRFIFSASAIERNCIVIQSLGQIGDPLAIPTLQRLAKSIWPLFPNGVGRMKVLLFKNLNGYPEKYRSDLTRWGIRSKNPDIRAACRHLAGAGTARERAGDP